MKVISKLQCTNIYFHLNQLNVSFLFFIYRTPCYDTIPHLKPFGSREVRYFIKATPFGKNQNILDRPTA